MPIDEKTWKSTRVDECEGSGVAKAIKAFDAAWPDPIEDVDAPSATAAFDAIKGLRAALASAKSKADKIDLKKSPKKATDVKATLKLIDDWSDLLDNYQKQLQVALVKRQDEEAKAVEKKAEAVRAKVYKQIDESFTESVRQITGALKAIDAALDGHNLQECYKQQAIASKAIRIATGLLTSNGIKEQRKHACAALKVSEVLVTVKSCTPHDLKRLQSALQDFSTELEKREKRLDDLESGDHDDAGEQATGTEDYKKNLKIIIGDYDHLVAVCADGTVKMGKLLTGANKLAQSAANKGEDPAKLLQIAATIRDQADAAENTLKVENAKVRDDNGTVVQKRKRFGITAEDMQKYLAPRMTRAFSKNMRALKTLGDVRAALDEVAEG